MSSLNEMLDEKGFDRLADILSRLPGGKAMNLEMMDGFFAALICSPEMVRPSEYLPEVLGGEFDSDNLFSSQDELQEFFELAMRHWNEIARTLLSGGVYLPLILDNEHGDQTGNDWGIGFKRGMDMRHSTWAELLDDEDHGGAVMSILALAYENDDDPELRPFKEPVSKEKRKKLLIGAAAGVMLTYKYFAPHRRGEARATRDSTTYRRSSHKVGRNEPGPCGSGKKYKKCCGDLTIH